MLRHSGGRNSASRSHDGAASSPRRWHRHAAAAVERAVANGPTEASIAAEVRKWNEFSERGQNNEINEMLADPRTKARVADLGAEVLAFTSTRIRIIRVDNLFATVAAKFFTLANNPG
jgi:uncharacterized protein (DUF885 family)